MVYTIESWTELIAVAQLKNHSTKMFPYAAEDLQLHKNST